MAKSLRGLGKPSPAGVTMIGLNKPSAGRRILKGEEGVPPQSHPHPIFASLNSVGVG